MKKQRKLALNKSTLANLTPTTLAVVAGGAPRTQWDCGNSENCTFYCNTYMTCPQTYADC